MQKQKMYMRPEAVIKYLLNRSEELDTMITCGGEENMITTDQALYEALATIKGEYDHHRLVKLLEAVEIESVERWKGEKRSILTPERAEEIMSAAGGEENE